MRRHTAAVLLAGIALIGAVPATASTGVSIDVARIAVSEDLQAGNEYRLPTFGVRNPGTEPTAYVLTVSYVDDQQALQPPASWFEFTPGELTLEPEVSRPVQTTLRVPPDAEPGDYAALIGPQIASTGSGAHVGAAAAARLSFTVVPSSWLEGWLRWLWGLIGEHPWLLLIPALIGLAVAWWFLGRRYAFSVSRRV